MNATAPVSYPATESFQSILPQDAGEDVDASPAPPVTTQILEIPWRLPGLNEIIAANASALTMRGKRVSRYTQLKRQWTNTLAQLIMAQGIRAIRKCYLRFSWHEENHRRDPDNIAAGGRKLILDALVKSGRLPNDGWANIAGWSDVFDVTEQAGITVEIMEVL